MLAAMNLADTPSPDAAPARSPRLLLIDDSPEDLRQLSGLLSRHYRLLFATDGLGGFHRAQSQRPDLILLDVQMPGLDGHAVCRLLQADAATCAIPLIFLSAANRPEQRLQGLQGGAVDYIGKPFLAEEVLARVHIHLRAGRAVAPEAASDADPDLVFVRAATGLIGEQLGQLPSVAQIAQQVGLSERRLSTLFRQHLGLTVSGFVSEERIRVGGKLLAETGMSVQEVASEVGFASAGNFSTAFRERLGLTPQAWRQQQRAARS